MRALIDTNVILDVLLAREPHLHASAKILDLAERGYIQGILCATTITTIFYFTSRQLGRAQALESIKDLIAICSVASINRAILESSLDEKFPDFEDAVLNQAAITAGAQHIITRNPSDFTHSNLLIQTPQQFLESLQ